MQEKYKDRNGELISVGDVLVYNEGDGYGQSIEEVVEHEGELATLMRVGKPRWTILENQKPMPLKFYKPCPPCSDNTATHATIVDVPHGQAFTAEFAESQFGA